MSKQNSWKSFLGQINPHTNCRDMWNCVRRINGANKYFAISQIEENGIIYNDPKAIANILGQSFVNNSDSSNYIVYHFNRQI